MPDKKDESDADPPFGSTPADDVRRLFRAVQRFGPLTMLKMGLKIQSAYQDQADSEEDSPQFVFLNERSRRIARLAESLAAAGREDDGAVTEIQIESGNNLEALRVAALHAREGGRHHELPAPNREHRLLQAAINKTAVAPPDEVERARLAVVGWFESLTRDERWAELVSREPRLSELEEDLRSGRLPASMPSQLLDDVRSGYRPDRSASHRRTAKGA